MPSGRDPLDRVSVSPPLDIVWFYAFVGNGLQRQQGVRSRGSSEHAFRDILSLHALADFLARSHDRRVRFPVDRECRENYLPICEARREYAFRRSHRAIGSVIGKSRAGPALQKEAKGLPASLEHPG